MRIRGMRDVVTRRRPTAPDAAQRRQQAADSVARLEHERMRLLREAQMWRSNLARVEGRLAQIEAQVNALQTQLAAPDRPTATGRDDFRVEY